MSTVEEDLPDNFDLRSELKKVAKDVMRKCILDFNQRFERHFTPERMDAIANSYFERGYNVEEVTTLRSVGGVSVATVARDSTDGSVGRERSTPFRSMIKLSTEPVKKELNLGLQEPAPSTKSSEKPTPSATPKPPTNVARTREPAKLLKVELPTPKPNPTNPPPKPQASSSAPARPPQKPEPQKPSSNARRPPRGRPPVTRVLRDPRQHQQPQHVRATQQMVGNEWGEEEDGEEDLTERAMKYYETNKKISRMYKNP